MWLLETDCGSYAIKQLSADTDVNHPDVNKHYNVTEAIAEEFSHHGISSVFALGRDARYLQCIDNIGYLVYPWTTALAIGKNDISKCHAHEVACVLAKMHGANLTSPELQDAPVDSHSEENAILLVHRAVECNIHNAMLLKEHLPTLLDIISAHQEATYTLAKHRVISHGDLDHKNVLWGDEGTPIIIDWESVRRLNPTHELLLEALDWSGITSTFQHGLFETFISSYREAGGEIDRSSIQACFDCILGDWLTWLLYNVGRAVDLEDEEQHSIGTKQVDLSLSTLLRLRHLMPQLLAIACSESESHV